MLNEVDVQAAANAIPEDMGMGSAHEAPTTIPCGITISITLGC